MALRDICGTCKDRYAGCHATCKVGKTIEALDKIRRAKMEKETRRRLEASDYITYRTNRIKQRSYRNLKGRK